MQPPHFLIGKLPSGEQCWAAIDPTARYTEHAIAERRFGAYLRPFTTEEDARAALIAAGAQAIEVEVRKRRG